MEDLKYSEEWYSLKRLQRDFRELNYYGSQPAQWQVERVRENAETSIKELNEGMDLLNRHNQHIALRAIENEIALIQRILKRLQKKYPEYYI